MTIDNLLCSLKNLVFKFLLENLARLATMFHHRLKRGKSETFDSSVLLVFNQFLEYLNFNFIFQALIQLYISSKCFLNGPFSFSFSFNFVFSRQLIVKVQYKFEPWTSGVGSNRSISWATTTARVSSNN